ncbi:MAG: RecX family transcriptional regulator [Oscillospiraceae bacterium]|nr:RecX family transcriptional regulator [Oscillospiraceae bacterium]
MRVERIERSKRKQERMLVHLEGGDLLRITEDELLRFDLYTGLDISPETMVELQKCAARSETRVRAVNMISARPLNKKELQKRLRGKGAADADAEAAAEWLEEIGALDDLAYAKTVVRHYSANGYGEAKLRDELRRRGVPREHWDEALADAPDPAETIARVIASKTKDGALGDRELKKLSEALLRRGFAWRDVRAALSALGEEIPED